VADIVALRRTANPARVANPPRDDAVADLARGHVLVGPARDGAVADVARGGVPVGPLRDGAVADVARGGVSVGPSRDDALTDPPRDSTLTNLVRGGALAGLVRDGALAGLVQPASAYAGGDDPTGQRLLPVLTGLRELLPGGGLRRGSTVAVAPGVAATSVMLALLASASAAGSWCAVAGLPTLGALAADELGVALERLALVPHPGPDWPGVVAALLDGVDLVVIAPAGPVAGVVASRLAARARQRGSVLIPLGGAWPGADVVLRAERSTWHGLGSGRGRLRYRELEISAYGRGSAAQPCRTAIWLPGPGVDPGTPVSAQQPPDAPRLEAVG
jgi:hypothetical protein